MRTGRDLNALVAELMRQAETKQDFVVPMRKAEMVVAGGDDAPSLGLRFGDQALGIRPIAHRQLGEHLGIPANYYDRASELERLGGEVIELPRQQWRSILDDASKKADRAESRETVDA